MYNYSILNFRTAMHAGAYNDQVECMELLEQRDGNINAVDADGNTPLMIAAERGNETAIGMLLLTEKLYVDIS